MFVYKIILCFLFLYITLGYCEKTEYGIQLGEYKENNITWKNIFIDKCKNYSNITTFRVNGRDYCYKIEYKKDNDKKNIYGIKTQYDKYYHYIGEYRESYNIRLCKTNLKNCTYASTVTRYKRKIL